MRGVDHQQSQMFSYLSPETRVRKDHPLRAIRSMVDEVLAQLSRRFDTMYASVGRPSIPPEKLLRAQLLQMLYSIRSERLLMEEIDYSLLFRWFVGLNLDEEVWDATTFTKNRDRLLEAEVAKEFLAQVVARARTQGLTSDEHFTVDGTLLEAWAGAKSFQRKDGKTPPSSDDPGNPTVNFHGEKRSNQTHASKTDPDAKLARKGVGKEAKLSYSGNLLVENRNGLIVNAEVFEANGTAERDAALVMLEQIPGTQPVTAGGDKGYDTADFVAECRQSASDASRGAKRSAERRKRHRRTYHAPPQLCHQPTEEEAHRRVFRVAEDDRAAAESASSRDLQGGLGIHLRLCRLQPGAYSEPEPGGGSTRLSRGKLAPPGLGTSFPT
jgi:transposase